MTAPAHVPVLLDRVVALVAPALERPGSVLVDATLGLGGHTEAVLEPLPAGPRHRHRPRPPRAGAQPGSGSRRSASGSPSCTRSTTRSPTCSPTTASPTSTACCSTSASRACSSTSRDRGFSYAEDAPLDMRMDDTTGRTAADVLNTYSRRRPGPGAPGVRRGAVRPPDRRPHRASGRAEPFTPSERLVDLVRDAIPAATRRTGGHPAKRTFQALRIEVNDELAVLRRALPAALDALGVGRPGRRHVLPLARGPAHQAALSPGSPRRRPARPPGRPRGAPARCCGC